MHTSVHDFGNEIVAEYDLGRVSVIEIGSRNINGTARSWFSSEADYLGLDMIDGPGVDRVTVWPDKQLTAKPWDVAVYVETAEHDPHFWAVAEQLHRVVRKGGRLIMTTRGIDFPYHEYPSDLWRFTEEGVNVLLSQTGWKDIHTRSDPECPGVFATAIR